jgi:hypothetical protein
MLAFFLCYILLANREEIVMTKPLLFAGDVSKHRIEHAVSHISTTFVSLFFFLTVLAPGPISIGDLKYHDPSLRRYPINIMIQMPSVVS